MTSFESFRLSQLKNIYIIYIYFLYFFLKYIMVDKLHHFMKKIRYFASNYGILTGIKIKLCTKSFRKKKSGRGLKSNLHNLYMSIITVWV